MSREGMSQACGNCGKQFTPKRPWQLYCSPTCRVSINEVKRRLDALTARVAQLERNKRNNTL